ncbi:MAG TPA: NAD-dependent epimerase/dehydratase family protein [Trebonia sp.]
MGQGTRGRVLVTGATGYAAGFCIRDLLAHGYAVRGTVRNLNTSNVEHLRPLGEIELAQVTLDDDAGWAEAVEGCDYVLHVASPIPFKAPKHEDELIRPAVGGTTRVLRAAAKAGVRRVVCTSSLDAVTQNSATADRVRADDDWSDLAQSSAYGKSKILAEKAAWDLSTELGLEVSVILPGAIIGPQLQVHVNKDSTSDLVRRILAGGMPAIPPINLGFSDVRDLATAHRLAIEVPAAAGNRYICADGPLWLTDVAQILKDEYGPRGYRVSTRPVPAWVIRAVAVVSDEAKLAVSQFDANYHVTAEKARRDLGWVQRPVRQTILETAEYLIEKGIVRPKKVDTSKTTAGVA